MKSEGLSKRERMASRKLIEALFKGGHSRSASALPIRVVYRQEEQAAVGDATVQVLMSVSKRHFKRAVKRNRIKRQMREAYRHNKQLVVGAAKRSGKPLYMAFIWQADHLYESKDVADSVKSLLQRVAEKL